MHPLFIFFFKKKKINSKSLENVNTARARKQAQPPSQPQGTIELHCAGFSPHLGDSLCKCHRE